MLLVRYSYYQQCEISREIHLVVIIYAMITFMLLGSLIWKMLTDYLAKCDGTIWYAENSCIQQGAAAQRIYNKVKVHFFMEYSGNSYYYSLHQERTIERTSSGI